MCGINGIINFNQQPVSEESLRTMMQAQKHRGPDDEGVFMDGATGLGFVRLSILDLSRAGHQPMYSQDKRYVIIYNGEIFNYIELRKELVSKGHTFTTATDTEVILEAFSEWGEACFHKFNGMWAMVIYDTITKDILISRDRYGIKPFYYYLTDDQLIFASEIRPILSVLPNKPEADYQTISDYLIFNRTDHTANTFFKGIRKLQHGHNMKIAIGEGKSFIYKWYHLEKAVAKAEAFQDAESYLQCFDQSVGLRLRSDVPVGVCLSGGLDSSAIVYSIVKKHQIEGLNTFSAVYEEGVPGDESMFIQLFRKEPVNMFFTAPSADSFFEDLMTYIRSIQEPTPTSSPYFQYKIMELASQNVVVTLDGQGADEQLAGYHYFFGYFFKDLLRKGKILSLVKELAQYGKIHRSLLAYKSFIFFLLPSILCQFLYQT